MRFLSLALLAILLTSCSSTPSRPVFADFVEVREIQNDDPLASRFSSEDGEEYHLGDPVISGKAISRLQLKPGEDEMYDLYITLTGATGARWRRFARSRGREAALVIDGRVCCVFPVQDPEPAKDNSEVLIIRIPAVAETEESASEMENYFEENKKPKQ